MDGDQYQVFYHLDGHTCTYGPAVALWVSAKTLRNECFNGDVKIRAVWVMRSNRIGFRQQRYGRTLRRTKYETT